MLGLADSALWGLVRWFQPSLSQDVDNQMRLNPPEGLLYVIIRHGHNHWSSTKTATRTDDA